MVLRGRLEEAEVGLILASITLRSGPLLSLSPLSFFFFFCSRTRREIVFILASFFSPLSLILSYLFFFFFYVVAQTWETLDSSFSSKEWEDREFNDQKGFNTGYITLKGK